MTNIKTNTTLNVKIAKEHLPLKNIAECKKIKSFYLHKISFLVAIFFLISCTQSTSAASFDCGKASNPTEKMICAHPDISELDNTLGTLFTSLKGLNLPLLVEQKKWLKETRDACKTAECLKDVYGERIVVLRKIDTCLINEEALTGSWSRIEGSSFEEMNFSSLNGINSFVSWLHHRPEMTGTWKIDKCTIFIKHNTEEKLQFEFKIKKIENNKLHVFDADANINSIYNKIK